MFIFNNIINNLFSDILILGAPGTISSVLLSVSLAMFFICIMSRDSTFFFIRLNSYILANIPFIMFLPILYSFDIKIGLPQQTVPLLVETMKYFTYNPPSLFVDGISIFFILLTVFIIPLTLLVS